MIIIQVPSQSSNRVYEVRKSDKDGAWVCSCPSWRFQRQVPGNQRSCKHMKQVVIDLGQHVLAAR